MGEFTARLGCGRRCTYLRGEISRGGFVRIKVVAMFQRIFPMLFLLVCASAQAGTPNLAYTIDLAGAETRGGWGAPGNAHWEFELEPDAKITGIVALGEVSTFGGSWLREIIVSVNVFEGDAVIDYCDWRLLGHDGMDLPGTDFLFERSWDFTADLGNAAAYDCVGNLIVAEGQRVVVELFESYVDGGEPDAAFAAGHLGIRYFGDVPPPEPTFTFDTGFVDFGEVAVGESSASATIGILNIGSDIGETWLVIDGPFARSGGDCGVPVLLDVGESCTVEVTYTASAAGVVNGSLHFTNAGSVGGDMPDGRIVSVALRGVGVDGEEPPPQPAQLPRAIPALDPWLLVLLAGLLGAIGARRRQ